MAINPGTVVEIRTTGNDNSGGGYDAGIAGAGTDYSQQDAAQLSLTDLATPGAGSTTLTSVTGGFTAAMIGNAIHITSGTNFTAAVYFIIARTDTNTVTLDRTPSPAGAGSIGVGAVGGAMASPGKAAQRYGTIQGVTYYIKSGTYSVTTSTLGTNSPMTIDGGATADVATKVIGYGTTRNDGGTKPIILNTTITGIRLIWVNGTGSFTVIDNMELNGNSPGASWVTGIQRSVGALIVKNCKVRNCTSYAIQSANVVFRTEVTGCSSNGTFTDEAALSSCIDIVGCYIHDNTTHGIMSTSTSMVADTVIDTNTGGTTDGIKSTTLTNSQMVVKNCTIYGNGQHGINFSPGSPSYLVCINTVAVNNGGYGFKLAAAGHDLSILRNCAGYNNTSGNYITAEWGEITSFVALTADPFNNAAGGDFSLNAAAAGSSLKDAGYPGAIPGSTSTGYLDIGAIESACGGTDTGGGGGNPTISGEQLWMLTSGRKVERWQASATTDDGTALPAWVYKTGVLQVNEKSYVRRILSQVETATVTATVLNSPATGETGQAKTLATVEDEKRYPPHYKGYTWCIKLGGANTAAVTRLHLELAPVEGEGSERTT